MHVAGVRSGTYSHTLCTYIFIRNQHKAKICNLYHMLKENKTILAINLRAYSIAYLDAYMFYIIPITIVKFKVYHRNEK